MKVMCPRSGIGMAMVRESPAGRHGPLRDRGRVVVAAFYELCEASELGIFAVPYRAGRRGKAMRLLDGTIVEEPLPDQGCEASPRPEGHFEVGSGGVPATIHHAYLGLITGFLPLSGVYLLSSGEVAAVYGAAVVPISAGLANVR